MKNQKTNSTKRSLAVGSSELLAIVSSTKLQQEVRRQLTTKKYLDNPIYLNAVKIATQAMDEARKHSLESIR